MHSDQVWALRAQKVIPAGGKSSLRDAVIMVRDGVIELVAPSSAIGELPGSMPVWDLGRLTVLPGLVDTHVHALTPAKRDAVAATDVVGWGLSSLQEAIRRGVTTVRDLGAPYYEIHELRDRLRSDPTAGPRLLAAGMAICRTGGHTAGWIAEEASSPKDAADRASEQIARGAEVIKVMVTGGAASADAMSVEMDADMLRAVAAIAHNNGLPVVGHVYSTAGAHAALDAGLDGIEHGVALDKTVIRRMARAGTVLSPTLSVYQRISETPRDHTPQKYAHACSRIEQHRTSVEHAVEAGISIVLGTDSGPAYHPVGDVLVEMQLLASAGLSNHLVIEAATSGAAASCGLSNVGALAPGMRADILVVEGDPEEQLESLEQVRHVLRDGHQLFGSDAVSEP